MRTSEIVKTLPKPIQDYYHAKQAQGQTASTLYTHILHIQTFVQWLRDATNEPVDSFLTITTPLIQDFIIFLREKPSRFQRPMSNITLNSYIQSLNALFNWLSTKSDNPQYPGQTYYAANPMSKIEFKQRHDTQNAQTERLERQMFKGQLKHDLIDFLQTQYPSSLSPQQLSQFKVVKERNIAIIALLFASGLRISELVGLNINDIDLTHNRCYRVIRKGQHLDTVDFAKWANPYIQSYLDIRRRFEPYPKATKEKALFITYFKHQTTRLTTTSIDRMFKKYTTAFGRPSTPHKARHTFGTELYQATKSQIDVQNALGQSTDAATKRYIHSDNQSRKSVIENL